MRILVFLLILANLLFLAYAQGYFGTRSSPDARRQAEQVRPELLQPVVPEPMAAPAPGVESAHSATAIPDAPPAVPAASAAAARTQPESQSSAPGAARSAPACLLLAGLEAGEAAQLEVLAGSASLSSGRRSEGGWWVFMPPQPDRKGAEKKAAELQGLGVKEFFIVTEGAQRHAISLGIFSREAAAQKHLEELRRLGVRTARIGQRQVEGARQMLEISGDAAALEGFRAQIAGAYTPKACP